MGSALANCYPCIAIFASKKAKIAKDILNRKISTISTPTARSPAIGITLSHYNFYN